MSDLLELVALSLFPLPLSRTIGEALREGEAPRAILDRLIGVCWTHRPEKRAQVVPKAAAAIARAAKGAVMAVPWSSAAYPPLLATIFDPPPVLWIRGGVDMLARLSVAIVGSRAGSPYALAVAERLAADLSSRGVTVVSGLARGVDSAAHRGALDVSTSLTAGGTVAVLGSGADVIYPAEHRSLADQIAARGAIVSELVPGTPPQQIFFPRRNRIISGLAQAVVVIEAGEKSGSLITARAALEQGRDVLAVPGNVLTGRNRGAHALLKDGAKIVETADDILEELGMPVLNPGPGQPASNTEIDPVLACFTPGEPSDLDRISGLSGLSPAQLLPRLLDLELQGLVGRAGGGRFVRFDRPC
jgi:DNA processing protein